MTQLEKYKERLKEMTISELRDEAELIHKRAERERRDGFYTRVAFWKIDAMRDELDRRCF